MQHAARGTVRLHHGVAPQHRAAAAVLYWQAFGAKLHRVLGPEPLALRYLERVIRADHAICAVGRDGRLVGVAGFRTVSGSFAATGLAEMRAVYGLSGALWRRGVFGLLSHEVENRRFLMDGICVAETARGQGIGSALLDAICDEARRRGFDEVRLDVVDTNPRARALYERAGFVAQHDTSIGLLRHVFGFRSATAMVRRA